MSNKDRGTEARKTKETAAGTDGFSLISNEKLIALYANLLKCRLVEQSLPRKARTGGSHGWIQGHEAGTVGVALDLGAEDAIFSPEHGMHIGSSKRAPMETLLLASWSNGGQDRLHPQKSEFSAARRNGASPANGGASYTHAAIGAALANKTKKNGKIAVVFGHAGASEPWREALEIASVHGLPMIFVSAENGRRGRARRKPRAVDGKAGEVPGTAWFPSIIVDRHDVVAVYRVANEAISRARQGRGPTLIECRAFRLSGRGGAIRNSNNGRPVHDPVLHMEHYLRGKGLFSRKLKVDIRAEFRRELDAAMKASKRAFRA